MLPGGRYIPRKIVSICLLLGLAALFLAGCADDGSPVEPPGEAGLVPVAGRTVAAASAAIPGSYIVVFKHDVLDARGLATQLVGAARGRPSLRDPGFADRPRGRGALVGQGVTAIGRALRRSTNRCQLGPSGIHECPMVSSASGEKAAGPNHGKHETDHVSFTARR
jgi:hypothetical protein